MIVSRKDLDTFDQRYRTVFVNSLAGFRQAVLVGTKSKEGFTNLAIFNSLIHLGAHPPLFGLISRPDSVPRHTLQNILDTQVYTLNFIPAEHFKKAHQTSARYEKERSECKEVGFHEVYHANCPVPFVEEAVIKIAMKWEECIPIQLNNTKLIVGSIMQVDLDETIVAPDGFVDLSEANTLISQGLDAYFISQKLGRLPYAKP